MRIAIWAVLLLSAGRLAAQTISADVVRKTVSTLAARAAEAKEYEFEAEIGITGQRGKNPGRVLAQSKVHLAAAPGGKFYLRVKPAERDEYLLVSDGQKNWAFVPKLKQYTEEEGGALIDEGDESEEGESDSERDMADTFSRQVVRILADMVKTIGGLQVGEPAEVKYEGKKQKWPLVRVMSRKASNGDQSMTELTVDPETLRLGRLVYASAFYGDGERSLIRLQVDFQSFRMGESVDPALFVFQPGKAKLADAIPIPGQTGSFLLNKPAPDFELKTLEGEKVRLSELRDKPVLLSFWASWCGPCRKELPGLARIYDELGPKGLVILGVNDEGRGTAKKFAESAGLSFPTLDDSGLKAHRLYKVRSIPTVFLIDREGKVVRFFSGAKEEAALRSALKTVGF